MNSSAFICIFVIYCVTVAKPSKLLGYGVNCSDKKVIVDMHNDLRRQIAQGAVPGQPKASNMLSLIWDDKLAKKAQHYAKKMTFEHNPKRKDRRFPVGENLYISKTTSSKYAGYDWKKAIQSWFDEHSLYTFGSKFSMAAGHYTQIVWADTTHIGCGVSYFKDNSGWYSSLYVCNYGPAGNYIGETPYKTGPGCENLCSESDSAENNLYGMFC